MLGSCRIAHRDRREPYVAAAADQSGITTDGPLAVGRGTAASDVTTAYPDAIQSSGADFDDGAAIWGVGQVNLVVVDDTVVGVGNEVSVC